MYIYIYIYIYIYLYVHVPKCWNGAAYMTRKQTCIFVLSVKLSAVTALAIWMPKP